MGQSRKAVEDKKKELSEAYAKNKNTLDALAYLGVKNTNLYIQAINDLTNLSADQLINQYHPETIKFTQQLEEWRQQQKEFISSGGDEYSRPTIEQPNRGSAYMSTLINACKDELNTMKQSINETEAVANINEYISIAKAYNQIKTEYDAEQKNNASNFLDQLSNLANNKTWQQKGKTIFSSLFKVYKMPDTINRLKVILKSNYSSKHKLKEIEKLRKEKINHPNSNRSEEVKQLIGILGKADKMIEQNNYKALNNIFKPEQAEKRTPKPGRGMNN